MLARRFLSKLSGKLSAERRLGLLAVRYKADYLRVGVIGCGRIGQVHLKTLSNFGGAKVTMIADAVGEVAKASRDKYGIASYTTNAQELIRSPDVDAVWVCSPSGHHADQIKEAAANGKHIFCEKPLATDLAMSKEVVRFAESKGVLLMTAFQRRFDSAWAEIKRAVVAGDVGRPITIRSTSRDPYPPPLAYVKGGGGYFKDSAIHDLDLSRWISASEPDEILATGSMMVSDLTECEGPEAIDTAYIIVKFENGATAFIDLCRKCTYGYDQRVEVFGDNGMVSGANKSLHSVTRYNASGAQASTFMDFFMDRYAEAYSNETIAFCEAVAQGSSDSICTGQDGVQALRMSIAAERSLAENRWVKMSEI